MMHFQEVDIVGITTKYYQVWSDWFRIVMIWDGLSKRHFTLRDTGRPGPVVIDLPKDVMAELGERRVSDRSVNIRGYKPNTNGAYRSAETCYQDC